MAIKRVQRFTLTLGEAVFPGVGTFITVGAGTLGSDDNNATLTVPQNEPLSRFVWVDTGSAFNPEKTFLTFSTNGHAGSTNEGLQARIYSDSGYPSPETTSWNRIQIYQRGNWPVNPYKGNVETLPAITIEVVEFD